MNQIDTTSPLLPELGALVARRLAPVDVPEEHWPALMALTVEHRLRPLLGWVLEQDGFALPDAALDKELREDFDRQTYWTLHLDAAQRRLQKALAAAGVQTVWLKGIALAHTLYPEPALRPMKDLDVLVPAQQLQAALGVATRLGYKPYPRTQGWLPDDLLYHHGLLGPGVPPVVLEIHSRLLEVGGEDSLLPVEKLSWFRQPEQLSETDGGMLTLRPEAHLLYLCAHIALQHSAEDLRLIRVFDIHLLVDGDNLDWAEIVERAAWLRWSLAVEQSLLWAERYFGTRLPAGLIERLRQPAQASQTAKPSFEPNHIQTDLDTLNHALRGLSYRQRLTILYRLVLPPRRSMRQRYNIRRQAPVWPYYPLRWGIMLGRTARAALLWVRKS